MQNREIVDQIRYVIEAEAQSISKLQHMLDFEALTQVVDLLKDCKNNGKKVMTTGLGTSAVAAKKIAHTLSCIEIPAFFLSPTDAVHGRLGCLTQEDVVIAISKGGGSEEIIKLLPAIRTKGAKLVSVTENKQSLLALAGDILVNVKVDREPDPFNMLATASTLAVISTFDAIIISLMMVTHYKKEQFAVIHPGGAVGDRLLSSEKITKE